jgi:hypothetical protein
MKPTIVRRRGRALASLTATMGLCLGAASVVSAPAQSAEPAGDCAARVPVSVAKGDPVTGLTVTGVGSSTAPEGFTGEVLGVVDDGIAPDLDMVMVRLSSPEIDRVGGIWQGMSGSPVYGPDGELIGAVAYGLSFGPSPVAGVTPFVDMASYLGPAPATRVDIGARAARVIAENSDVTAAQADRGFAQLPMPTGVSGVGQRRLEQAAQQSAAHRWMPTATYRMGAAAAPGDGAAGPETIVAGGNLAATVSYGDVTQGGVGTATSVCNGKVVGFGHPMTFLGKTTLTLHPADALYIQDDPTLAPYKVANLGAPAGTITDDHLAGITGTFGALPATSIVSSTASYLGRSRTGTSRVSVPQAAASTTFFQLLGNQDRVFDAVGPGSSVFSWTIQGHEAGVGPFTLSVADRYASDFDISFEPAFDIADFVFALSTIRGVKVDSVKMNSVIEDDSSTWAIARVEQRRAGAWRVVNGRHPAVGRAGRELKLRAVLVSGRATTTAPVSLSIPRRAAGAEAELFVLGGAGFFSEDAFPASIAQAKRFVRNHVRNDQVLVELNAFGPRGEVRRVSESPAQEKVVTGEKFLPALIK